MQVTNPVDALKGDPFCAAAFPDISQVQLDYLKERFGTISTAIHDLLKQMKRSMKK